MRLYGVKVIKYQNIVLNTVYRLFFTILKLYFDIYKSDINLKKKYILCLNL